MGLISGTTTSEYLIKLSLMHIPKNWQIFKIYIFTKTVSYKLRLWINFANFISSDRKPTYLCNFDRSINFLIIYVGPVMIFLDLI